MIWVTLKKYKVIIIIVASIFLFWGFPLLEEAGNKDTLIKWCGLAQFPKSAKIIENKRLGSLTYHSFRCKFSASKEEINNWVKNSVGLSNEHSTHAPPSKKDMNYNNEFIKAHDDDRYIIYYTPGINHAEVSINVQTNIVTIYAWDT